MAAGLPLRILFVEDLPSDMELAERELGKEGLQFRSLRVETEKAFLEALADFRPDVIISDYALPEFDGMRALKLAIQNSAHLPFIILTGSMNEDTAVACLKAGATDYVVKEHLTRLPFAVREALEQKRAERTLRLSEEKFKQFFENEPEYSYMVSIEGIILDMNGAALEALGYEKAEIVGKPVTTIYAPESLARHRELFEKWRETGTLRDEELVILGKNGIRRTVLLSSSAVRDDSGRIVHSVSVQRDVTARKAAELRLVENVQRLREAQESLARRSRWVLALNSVASEIARRNNLESILQVVMHYLEENFPFELGGIGLRNEADGSATIVTMSARGRSLAGRLGIHLGLRVPPSHGLRPDSATAPDPMTITLAEVDPASLAEPGVELLSRLREAGLIAVVMVPLSADPVKIGGVFMLYREAMVIGESEREFLRGIAEYASLAVQNRKLYDELDDSYAVLKKTQVAMMEQERLKAMGQMASGIAHDINNTLAPIALYAEALAASELGRAEPARRYLRTIQEAVRDIEQITMRLRSFYKGGQEEGELQAIDPGELLNSVAELTRPRWKDMPNRQGVEVRLETETEAKLPPLVGNATEIREALINLIFNAVDAMPAGGLITIRARQAPGSLLLEVIDTGVGMNAELRQRCLEPFFTTKGAEGSGLGLSVAYGTMQRHHGEIEVESEEGQGTTVRLVFPILPGRPRESSEEAETSDAALPRLRILCVDDDAAVRTVLTEMLAQSGQEVESRGSGEEAMAALLSAKAEGKGFDLVITDLGMPHMDGKELARRIKSSSPGTPVILLSGWGSFLGADQESGLEVDCVLSKPPTIAGLQRAIRKIRSPRDPAGGTQ